MGTIFSEPLLSCGTYRIAAVRWHATAAAQREAIGIPVEPSMQAADSRAIDTLRRETDEPAFAATWDAGQILPRESTISEALAFAVQIAGDPGNWNTSQFQLGPD
jgi:hypothetical protein